MSKEILSPYLNNNAYDPNKLPIVVDGHQVISRAPELKYEVARGWWSWTNRQIEKLGIDRKDSQIVVWNTPGNVTVPLYEELKNHRITKYPVAGIEQKNFPDRNSQILVEDEIAGVDHIYLVASTRDMTDITTVVNIANHYKKDLGVKAVTLILSAFGPAREDKNINNKGEYRPNTVSARTAMDILSLYVDRAIIVEPHSSATQAYAASTSFPFPVAPISPWKFMLEKIIEDGLIIDQNNTVGVRPDDGRNLAAKRLCELLNLRPVSFNKERIGMSKTIFDILTQEEIDVLQKVTTALFFDDENQTMGTIEGVLKELEKYNSLLKAIVFFVHTKLTGQWDQKIKNKMLFKAYGTNSVTPIGDISLTDKLSIIDLTPFIIDLIKADMEGVNFWSDVKWSDTILQPRPETGKQ